MLNKGILVISQEIELAWGVHQTKAYYKLSKDGKRERTALSCLLQIYREYDVSITWGIVGHLFLERCNGKHPVSYTPDWYKDDPGTSLKRDPLWYGKDMVEEILNDPQNHEIASHSFSHVPFNSCSREVAEFEIEQCIKIAKEYGIKLKSFIFPYNLAGYFDLLEKYGFVTCRTLSLKEGKKNKESKSKLGKIRSTIYENLKKVIYGDKVSSSKYKSSFIRLANKFNILFNPYPIPTHLPTKILNNLYAIPMSKYLPLSEDRDLLNQLKIKRIKEAIDKAIERREILHLWSHLRDFKKERDFQNLCEILDYASEKREKEQLSILPMKSVIKSRPSFTKVF